MQREDLEPIAAGQRKRRRRLISVDVDVAHGYLSIADEATRKNRNVVTNRPYVSFGSEINGSSRNGGHERRAIHFLEWRTVLPLQAIETLIDAGESVAHLPLQPVEPRTVRGKLGVVCGKVRVYRVETHFRRFFEIDDGVEDLVFAVHDRMLHLGCDGEIS